MKRRHAAGGRRAIPMAAALALLTPAAVRSGALHVEVDSEGIYRIDAAALHAAGLHTPVPLRLSCRGKTVAHRAVLADGRTVGVDFFASDPGLSRGQPVVYRLEAGKGGRPASATTPSGRRVDTVDHVMRVERDEIYLPRLIMHARRSDARDLWVMQVLSSPRGGTVELAAPGISPGGGKARVQALLYGHTHLPYEPDHHLVVRLNGKTIGESRWDGQTEHRFDSGDLDAGLLRPDRNTLAFELPADFPAGTTAIDQVHLDWVEVTYPRRLEASSDTLVLPPSREPTTLVLGGSKKIDLWSSTGVATAAQVEGETMLFGLPPHDGARVELVDPARRLTPVRTWTARPAADPPGPVEYLAIGPEGLLAPLAPLLERRRAEGLSVLAVSAQDAYDRFGHGNESPEALKELVRRIHARGRKLRYLLLVGDANLGHTHDAAARKTHFLPTTPVYDALIDRAASDVWFGDLSGDVAPEVAVGRFPARSPAHVASAVAKTIGFEEQAAAPWRRRALLVAGVAKGTEPAYFADASDGIAAAALPPDFSLTRVYVKPSGVTSDHPVDRVPDPAATKNIVDAFIGGLALAHYVGHGGLNVWEDRQLLTLADVARIDNLGRVPLVLSMSCFTAFFDDYRASCIGEELLNGPRGGAAAFWGATGRSVQDSNMRLSELLLKRLFADRPVRLGDAIRLTLRDYLAERGMPISAKTYALLGDPALVVDLPPRTADPPETKRARAEPGPAGDDRRGATRR